MSTADVLNRQTQINRQKFRPVLSNPQFVLPNVFKEVDNQTSPVQYKDNRIFLVYPDIYMWSAARSAAEVAQIKSIQDLIQAFRRDRDAFLGTKTPASVTDQLDQVGKWPPGQVLLLMIKNQSDKITIIPDFISRVSGKDDVGGVPDSIAGATSVGMPVLDTVNWQGLPGGQGNDQIAMRPGNCARRHNEAAIPLACKFRQSVLHLVAVVHVDRNQLDSELQRGGAKCGKLGGSAYFLGIPKHGNACHMGRYLLEQL